MREKNGHHRCIWTIRIYNHHRLQNGYQIRLCRGTDRIYATSGFSAVVTRRSISVSGFSAAEDASSPVPPVENDLHEFDGRRCEYAVEQFVYSTQLCFVDVQFRGDTARRLSYTTGKKRTDEKDIQYSAYIRQGRQVRM